MLLGVKDQFWIGLALFMFLALPPVARFMESVMVLHMHMQMPMLVIAGILMAPLMRQKLARFFEKWNANGWPGTLLFIIVIGYWLLPRAMDDALTNTGVQLFKFISLPFLAGVSLRVSWSKLNNVSQNIVLAFFVLVFLAMGWIYLFADEQLCNNYLLIEQLQVGWGFILTAVGIGIYLLYVAFVDPSQYE
nr:hypothetical protein [Caldalkalibacillus thermarum]